MPASLLALLAQQGTFLPRTAFTYLNLGPFARRASSSVDQRISGDLTAFVNYSWQAKPTILSDPNPFPTLELALPPTNRFNVGFNYNGARFLASGTVNYADKAFWSDVLSSPYHGFTDAYTMVNATFGVKWVQGKGKVTTLVKINNLLQRGHPAARVRRHPQAIGRRGNPVRLLTR